jgi:hypothetical protein
MKTEDEAELPEGHSPAAQPEKEKPGHPFKVEVAYNGVGEKFEVKPDELVKTLLDKALQKFGPIQNPHMQALYNAAGEELADAKTLGEAGVKAGDELLLRPSKVKGGR